MFTSMTPQGRPHPGIPVTSSPLQGPVDLPLPTPHLAQPGDHCLGSPHPQSLSANRVPRPTGRALRAGKDGAGCSASGPTPPPHQPQPYLFHHHPELALGAEHGFDPRQPLGTGEDLGGADEHLARVEAVGIVEEETLRGLEPEASAREQRLLGDGASCAAFSPTPRLPPSPNTCPSETSTVPKTNPKAPEQHKLSHTNGGREDIQGLRLWRAGDPTLCDRHSAHTLICSWL